jgi:hypothetical protein
MLAHSYYNYTEMAVYIRDRDIVPICILLIRHPRPVFLPAMHEAVVASLLNAIVVCRALGRHYTFGLS